MGATFSPTIANIFMSTILRDFLQTQQIQPLLITWYIDDIFMIWTDSTDNLTTFKQTSICFILTPIQNAETNSATQLYTTPLHHIKIHSTTPSQPTKPTSMCRQLLTDKQFINIALCHTALTSNQLHYLLNTPQSSPSPHVTIQNVPHVPHA